MNRFGPFLRRATIAAALGLTSLLAAGASQAATYQIPFNTTGSPTSVAIVSGASGLMSFTLDLDDPTTSHVFGSFAMDVFGPGNITPSGRIDLVLGPAFTGILGPVDFGPIGPPYVDDLLPNVSLWQLAVNVGETPLTLVVTATLNSLSSLPFTPVLTLETDLTVELSAVPLPGTLALFATGLAAFGLLGRRRKNRMQEA